MAFISAFISGLFDDCTATPHALKLQVVRAMKDLKFENLRDRERVVRLQTV
ncbi:MAG TPA: hypothetical protein VJN42_08880 [Candidatus Acidoferrum sp.]|nr:hypothetical protein [Candidatus Acidoferrum sp.]